MASEAQNTSVKNWLKQNQTLARFELEITLCRVLRCSRAKILSEPERQLSSKDLDELGAWVRQLRDDVPLAYLCGEQEFWGLSLQVDNRVLVPRPDTETLVEQALLRIVEMKSLPRKRPVNVLDLGTGSGAIALALANELPDDEIHASDISQDSLAVARNNSRALSLRITFHHSDWFETISQRYDVITANPPYIAANDPHLVHLTAEPIGALVAHNNGMAALTDICETATSYLHDDGWLLLEHGFDQGRQVRDLLQENGYKAVGSCRDLGENERVTFGQKFMGTAECPDE